MYRMYIGNLDVRVSEETLWGLFEEHRLGPNNIQLRRGFAFVDYPDQNSVDRAIDTFNGKQIFKPIKYCMLVYLT